MMLRSRSCRVARKARRPSHAGGMVQATDRGASPSESPSPADRPGHDPQRQPAARQRDENPGENAARRGERVHHLVELGRYCNVLGGGHGQAAIRLGKKLLVSSVPIRLSPTAAILRGSSAAGLLRRSRADRLGALIRAQTRPSVHRCAGRI